MKKKSKKIYIGGALYHVRTQKKVERPSGMPKDVYILGQFRPLTHEIIYMDKLRESKNLTIIHELIHAIQHEYSLDFNEGIVDVLSRELTGSLCQLGILS